MGVLGQIGGLISAAMRKESHTGYQLGVRYSRLQDQQNRIPDAVVDHTRHQPGSRYSQLARRQGDILEQVEAGSEGKLGLRGFLGAVARRRAFDDALWREDMQKGAGFWSRWTGDTRGPRGRLGSRR